MATTKAQRIGISVILAVTIIGTIGSFAVMILSMQNQKKQDAQTQKDYAAYQKQYKDYQAKLQAQNDQLSAQYYPVLNKYASQVAPFDLNSAENGGIQTTDLQVGTGETVTDNTNFAAYYIGWLPSGKVFDQSIANGKLQAPLALTPTLANAGVIDGWKEGMKGMKLGGVRIITIPSGKAYGETGSKDSSGQVVIPPNTPLKFLVLAIPTPAQISAPTVPQSLLQQGL